MRCPRWDFPPVFRIRQDATASLILLWKVTATGFQQCSLVDGRSVTPLQAPGGLVLLEEMLALGPNHFIGESRQSARRRIPGGVQTQCVGIWPGRSELRPATRFLPFQARFRV